MSPETINQNIKVLIFEDDDFDLEAIKSTLDTMPWINIIKTCDNVSVALSECERLQPDLVIIDGDIRGDKNAGAKFAQNVRSILPNVNMLGLTKYPQCLTPLKQAGCREAVLKSFFRKKDESARRFIENTLQPYPEYYREDLPPELGIDEDKVLRRVAAGWTETQISNELDVPHHRVKDIKESLKRTFGAVTQKDAQLVSMAYRSKYLKPGDDLPDS